MMRALSRTLLAYALLAACGAAFAVGPRRPVVVLDERVRASVDVVATPALRARGLSGRADLAEGQGMLFLFEAAAIQSFWMKDMRFEIDILWIRDGRIVGITPNVPLPKLGVPLPRYQSQVPCDVVLELRGGAARRAGLLVGHSVRIER
jgi:uncharacterized protein